MAGDDHERTTDPTTLLERLPERRRASARRAPCRRAPDTGARASPALVHGRSRAPARGGERLGIRVLDVLSAAEVPRAGARRGAADIGFTVGFFSLATVLATPFAGWWSTAFRAATRWVGALLMAVSAAGFSAVATSASCSTVRVLQGLSYALVVTAVGTLVADVAPREAAEPGARPLGREHARHERGGTGDGRAARGWRRAGWPTVSGRRRDARRLPRRPMLAAQIREPHWKPAAGPTVRGRAWRRSWRSRSPATMRLVMVLAGATLRRRLHLRARPMRWRSGGRGWAASSWPMRSRRSWCGIVLGGVPARIGSYRVARSSLVLYAGVVFGIAVVRPAGLHLPGRALRPRPRALLSGRQRHRDHRRPPATSAAA